jgi:hypothetical protein
MRSALDAAHRERDARAARAHAARVAAKNRRDARAPPREEACALQLGTSFRTAQPDLRKMLDEMRMSRWRCARGAGLRDW